MRELIASDHNGEQACHLGDCAGEEVLERGESRIEWRAALGERDCGEQKATEKKRIAGYESRCRKAVVRRIPHLREVSIRVNIGTSDGQNLAVMC